MIKAFSLFFITVLITACASQPPFKDEGIDNTLTPSLAKQDKVSAGKQVMWGGTILNTENLKDKTRLEILSYPVDKKGRIDKNAEPTGRFYAIHDGYLEAAEYRKNRWISLTGVFTGKDAGKVGDADYTYPVVKVSQMHLWPVEPTRQRSPNVQFGIGVSVH